MNLDENQCSSTSPASVQCPWCKLKIGASRLTRHLRKCSSRQKIAVPIWPINLTLTTHPPFAPQEIFDFVVQMLKKTCAINSMEVRDEKYLISVPNVKLEAAINALNGKNVKTVKNKVFLIQAEMAHGDDYLKHDGLQQTTVWREGSIYGENSKWLTG